MYVLDANIFMEAKNRYYGFDIAPGFWEWIERNAGNAVLCSIDAVKAEIERGDDELREWAKAHPQMFFSLDQETEGCFPVLSRWAQGAEYKQSAVNAFGSTDADYLLVAYAMAHDYTVVTHERPSLGKKRIKIPDACKAMNVRVVDTFTMLREVGITLKLD